MARTGTVTLLEGIGKASGKPYTALKVVVGKVEKVIFDLTPLEKEHVKEYLSGPETEDEIAQKAKSTEGQEL